MHTLVYSTPKSTYRPFSSTLQAPCCPHVTAWVLWDRVFRLFIKDSQDPYLWKRGKEAGLGRRCHGVMQDPQPQPHPQKLSSWNNPSELPWIGPKWTALGPYQWLNVSCLWKSMTLYEAALCSWGNPWSNWQPELFTDSFPSNWAASKSFLEGGTQAVPPHVHLLSLSIPFKSF